MTGGVQKVRMCGAPLDVLCDLLPVFEPVEQLVCLDIKDPQEVRLAVGQLLLWLPSLLMYQCNLCPQPHLLHVCPLASCWHA